MISNCKYFSESRQWRILYGVTRCQVWSTNTRDDSKGGGFHQGPIRPIVLFPDRFHCPCDCVSLSSQKIHLRTGNLSVVSGTYVPTLWRRSFSRLCCKPLRTTVAVDRVSERCCSNSIWAPWFSIVTGLTLVSDSYLVDPASSHMLVSKIKPCMSKYKPH